MNKTIDQNKIRNFSIIAHIDHGKSTLADRILEITKSVKKREMRDQILDSMELEQERGITIKLNSVQLKYMTENGEYVFHLIDTPGHVDFTYEVSRSLAACEGAILVVDATQGIEAQTISNVYLALENNLEIIPVINKIDLPNANVEKATAEIINLLGGKEDEIIKISAKTGEGVKNLLKNIISRIPAPQGNYKNPLKALVFDSYFDPYKGVVVSICVKEGSINVGDKVIFMQTNSIYEIISLGVSTPKRVNKEKLVTGEVGWLTASIKNTKDISIGDTLTHVNGRAKKPLEGYKKLKPMVFCGIFPTDNSQYLLLKESLEKLQLNDSSLHYTLENSKALGFGFRCGFLGLLHMEIIIQRLEREFNINLIATLPSVIYRVKLKNGEVLEIHSAEELPNPQYYTCIEEPFVKIEIVMPPVYIGVVMELCQSKRGIYKDINYPLENRVLLIYMMPLSEIIYDFFDKLKSYSKGYASFDYELSDYRPSNLVKMDVIINGEILDALSMIVYKDFAYNRGKALTEKLKDIIPRQQFEISIQASIGNRIIARSTIKALRKNVLSKCYGGDISRKRKLLEKQKRGKKRMKYVGNIEIPQEAFLSALKIED